MASQQSEVVECLLERSSGPLVGQCYMLCARWVGIHASRPCYPCRCERVAGASMSALLDSGMTCPCEFSPPPFSFPRGTEHICWQSARRCWRDGQLRRVRCLIYGNMCGIRGEREGRLRRCIF